MAKDALGTVINNRGILEPVIVAPKDDKYLLLFGERQYLAARKPGHETIPARTVNTVTQKDEILAIQLTENLQREDLNPIDQAKHPDKDYNPDGAMSALVCYKRRSEDLPEGVAPTVGAIIEISAKSITDARVFEKTNIMVSISV